MKGYKTEIWVTVVCLILVCIAGGFECFCYTVRYVVHPAADDSRVGHSHR